VLDRQESQLPNPEPPAALQPPLPTAASSNKAAAGSSKLGLQQQLAQGPGGAAAAAAGAWQSGVSQDSSSAGSLHHHGIDVNQLASELSTHLAIDQINSPQARYVQVALCTEGAVSSVDTYLQLLPHQLSMVGCKHCVVPF
jgi:hypothetical protein